MRRALRAARGLAGGPRTRTRKAWAVAGLIAAGWCIAAERSTYSRTARELPRVPYHLMGLALADIDGDGFDDIIAAGGGEMTQGPLLVYFNDGHGRFGPPWESDTKAMFGFVAVADINQDGSLDVAVTVRGRESGIQVFYNTDAGLERTASFSTAREEFEPFQIAFGDEDGDALPDLAVGVITVGDGIQDEPVRIYHNQGGRLEQDASWRVTTGDVRQEGRAVRFDDLNGDGWLDLGVGAWNPLVYLGDGRRIESRAPWAVDGGHVEVLFALDAFSRGEDQPAIAVGAHNKCHSSSPSKPTGGLTAYAVGPTMDTLWRAAHQSGCYGAVALADLDGTGRPDIVAGRWGNAAFDWRGRPLQIFHWTGRTFSSSPWESESVLLAQSIAFSDLDNSALRKRVERFAIKKDRGVLQLPGTTVRRIESVTREGRRLDPREYLWVPGAHWISFAPFLRKGEAVEVRYWTSSEPDIVVSSFGVDAGYSGSVMIFDRQHR